MTLAALFGLGIVALGFHLTRPIEAADDTPHLRIRHDLRLRKRIKFALRNTEPDLEAITMGFWSKTIPATSVTREAELTVMRFGGCNFSATLNIRGPGAWLFVRLGALTFRKWSLAGGRFEWPRYA